uniref:Signal recognition particle 14 kDa protein n=1 Tax=Xenopsylla cheopis TaxID=163159 RepID=A0A6M2DFV4_XENCH
MVLLENDEFLSQLTRMFQSARSSSSVTLTMKRYDGRTTPYPREGRPPLPKPEEHLCLIRAVHKSRKISTVVKSKDTVRFHLAYCSLLKGNMDGLKKMKKVKPKVKAT